MPRDNATASEYDDPMSERLLGIAADVLRSFGSAFGGRHIAIVGGAVPSILVSNPPRGIDAHVGTADLDLHLSLHLLDGETADYYDEILAGLTSLGLRAATDGKRERKWRWVGQYRGITLFPIAGPASWLCLKSDAIMGRNKPKDAYDVVWVIDALGPHVVASQIATSVLLASEFADEVRHQLNMLIFDQFRDTDSIGPRSYATFLEADPSSAERRHAHGTLSALGEALRTREAI